MDFEFPQRCFLYAPNFFQSWGLFASGLSVCSFIHSSRFLVHSITLEPCMLMFWNLIYGFLVSKISQKVFELESWYLVYWLRLRRRDHLCKLSTSLMKFCWSYGPLQFLAICRFHVHSISLEPCMLMFWNFIYEFLMKKKVTCIFFLIQIISHFRAISLVIKITLKSRKQDIS